MAYKSKRSKATDIPMKVKKAVYERDGGMCIYCGRKGLPNAHYISRQHGRTAELNKTSLLSV